MSSIWRRSLTRMGKL